MKTMLQIFGSMAILIAVCAGAFASSAQEDEPPFNVEQWLNGPDREDFPWDVRISRPSLTFQQRYRVNIWAYFNADRLRKMLKPTKPKRYTIWESGSFRKDLADLISRLEKLAR
jgi:hypothetical protein